MCKSGICDSKPAIFLKRSSLEPQLLHSVYRISCSAYRLTTNLLTYHELSPAFPVSNIFPQRISRTHFVAAQRNLVTLVVWLWPIETYLFPEFRKLWSGDPVIPFGDMHQSFTDTLVKWFFDNFPMFADSFSVLSIRCVARELGASFLCKCYSSRGGSLRQHHLTVCTF